jgi:hypothetical protein
MSSTLIVDDASGMYAIADADLAPDDEVYLAWACGLDPDPCDLPPWLRDCPESTWQGVLSKATRLEGSGPWHGRFSRAMIVHRRYDDPDNLET